MENEVIMEKKEKVVEMDGNIMIESEREKGINYEGEIVYKKEKGMWGW